MNNKIIIINGPNINLLGEENNHNMVLLSFENLKEKFAQTKLRNYLWKVNSFSQILRAKLVTKIQESRKKFDGMIINAAGFTHTSVAIRDA